LGGGPDAHHLGIRVYNKGEMGARNKKRRCFVIAQANKKAKGKAVGLHLVKWKNMVSWRPIGGSTETRPLLGASTSGAKKEGVSEGIGGRSTDIGKMGEGE